MTFHALVLDQAGDGLTATVQELADDRLPDAGVTVRVDYSSLNYKDGWSRGNRAARARIPPCSRHRPRGNGRDLDE